MATDSGTPGPPCGISQMGAFISGEYLFHDNTIASDIDNVHTNNNKTGVIGMSHNAPFNIVCINFINIGRDGIIILSRRVRAAYQSKDHHQKPEAKNKSHGGIVDVRLCTDVERPGNGSRKP